MATLNSIKINEYVNGWCVKASADNAQATASKAGSSGQSHYVTAVSAGFSAAATQLLQIKDGDTVVFETVVADALHLSFPTPIKITAGNAVSAVLAASGTAGVYGYVNLVGFTA